MKRELLVRWWAAAIATASQACVASAPLPPRAVALNTAGARAIERGEWSSAEASLSVALEYSPRFVEAWVNLGYVELARGNFEQARRDFVHARDLNREIPATHHALGVLAERRGESGPAEGHYRAALEVDPGFPAARANLARCLFARGQYENAREQFERLAQVVPDAIEGWTGQIEALMRLGRFAQADQILDRAREQLGNAPALVLLLARRFIDQGEWAEAETTLAPLVGGPDRARAGDAWAWVGVARLGRGNAAEAIRAALEARAIDRDHPVAAYVLERAGKAGSQRGQ